MIRSAGPAHLATQSSAATERRETLSAQLERSAAFRQLEPQARDELVDGLTHLRDRLQSPDPAVRDAAARAVELVAEVDFPDFVSGLIEGTFHAIVDASIEQMRAYAELVKGVVASVDEPGASGGQPHDSASRDPEGRWTREVRDPWHEP